MSDTPDEQLCSFPGCSNAKTDPSERNGLCETHLDGLEGGSDTDDVLEQQDAREDTETDGANPGVDAGKTTTQDGENGGEWADADFTDPTPGEFPQEWAETEQWMCRIPESKHSFSPWADKNAPVECGKDTCIRHDADDTEQSVIENCGDCQLHRSDETTTCADCNHDARYKWGYKENYALLETALKWDKDHPRTGGVTFQLIESENEPFAFVDGDDVRCPETGEIHPEFVAVLERLGVTYADVSTSGSGVHAAYYGDLPDGVKQAKIQIDDEPWGANDDPPEVEIYDHKKVCVATGDHVMGTPPNVHRWDDDALESFLDEHDLLPEEDEKRAFDGQDRDSFDLEGYEPDATETDETTDDIRDIFAALDRIDARRVADKTIVHRWNDAAGTSGENRAFVPTWGKSANGTANIVDDELWQDTGGNGYGGPVVMALIDAGEMRPESASPRDARGELWWKGVEHLRELGFSIPEYEPPRRQEKEPTELEVTLDPEVAWRAVGEVTPEDTDELPLEVGDGGEKWLAPNGERVDVVRAVALAENILETATAPLQDRDFDMAYRVAREQYDAPLPEYVTHEMATDKWAVIQGALEQLTHRHLSRIESEITGLAEGDDDVIAEIDPCWADSATGKRIIALDAGGFYCREHETHLSPLELVALESGILDSCADTLKGDRFKNAYHTTREQYGAPLPEWEIGTPTHIPILPDAEQLLGDFQADIASLNQAREKNEELHGELVGDTGETWVLNSLGATGKSTAAAKNAIEHPTLYAAGRKELQQEVVEKAERWNVDYMVLPVFAENQVSREAKIEAQRIVHEEGKDVLRRRDELAERIDAPIFPDDESAMDDGDDVDLERASSPVANGDFGDEWALVVQVASELGYSPRDILTSGEQLFGEEVPTPTDGDPYSQAWKQATDPDNPISLLIGGRQHARVGGACTYYHKEDGATKLDPRAVVIDEYPGMDYSYSFGEHFTDHAAWLASCLSAEVEDAQDMFETELAGDEFVQSWLEGNGNHHTPTERAISALETMQNALEIVGEIDDLRDEHGETLRALGLERPLITIQDLHPAWDGTDANAAYGALDAAVKCASAKSDTERLVLERVEEDILNEFGYLQVGGDDDLRDDVKLDVAQGDLERMLKDAVDAFERRGDGSIGLLKATETALYGGEDGCRELAIHARDGYAHPLAYLLLYTQIHDGSTTINDSTWAFGQNGKTNLKRAELGRATILLDRNQHGAFVHLPPEFETNDGQDCAVVGLDATARERLWNLALGREVNITGIHETTAERRAFLRDVLNFSVVQTSPSIKSYSSRTVQTENMDGEVELGKTIHDEFANKTASVERKFGDGEQLDLETSYNGTHRTTDMGVITTKKARKYTDIEDRLESHASTFEHYGNFVGSNALANCNLGLVLGTQHWGDKWVDLYAALAGEETVNDRAKTGRGVDLDYQSPTANTLLAHMREDQTMQAILRFGRDEEGALVFAHTAALRDELPVENEGAVVTAYSEKKKKVAKAASEQKSRFTTTDIAESVDVSRRHVRRVLEELTETGHLRRRETKNGLANSYRQLDEPGSGEVELPNVQVGENPDEPPLEKYYTWSVRVGDGETGVNSPEMARGPILPAPPTAETDPPPG